jgi:hypothetical protein
MSWYALLSGMGFFPPPAKLRAPTPQEQPLDLAGVDDFVARSGGNFMSHAQALKEFPTPLRAKNLRIYRFN